MLYGGCTGQRINARNSFRFSVVSAIWTNWNIQAQHWYLRGSPQALWRVYRPMKARNYFRFRVVSEIFVQAVNITVTAIASIVCGDLCSCVSTHHMTATDVPHTGITS